ncbi:MAG: SUMF1/EgtB/PvdO family nonheme iron enzyme [Anaerolineae bacterium]|jgi:formylglycine-generating enzyme required for sulfatase activity|nr:SUMF1/EgtB/PvdO family nonheme iron enzyme [Anaerolineae bacterium]MDH7474207.1 SUMF1/EgtB/PvdO family nonheme iron enzyme [Anaerolineae bacterium]
MDPQGYHQRMAAWRRFLHEELPPRQRAIVACRVADYGNGLDLPRLEIQPLDPQRIQQFLREYLPDRAEDLWRDLLADRERHGEAHSVYGLAANPFWLTMIVAVYRAGGLPESHADLVERFVDNWLQYEGQRPGGRACSPEEIAAFKIALSQMAYPFLERGQNTPQPEALARTWLPEREVEVSGRPVPTPCDETLRLAESINLIVREGRPEARTLRFYHHLLLEHFAGRELLRRFAAGEDQSHHWRIPWENWQFVESEWDPLPGPPTTGWEEATALAAGYAAPCNSLAASEAPGLSVVEALTRAVLAHNPPLAARCLLEAGPLPTPQPPPLSRNRERGGGGGEAVGGGVRAAIVARLLETIAHPPRHLNPRQRVSLRIACGLALGHLGDPRILGENGEQMGTVELDGRPVTFIEPRWCTVPAGPFLMGSDPEHDPDFYKDELPQHRCDLLDYDYRIGMYPVTNAEHDCFVRAGGYQDPRWWRSEAARRWLQGQADIEPTLRYWRWLRDLIRADPDLPDRYERQKLASPQETYTWRWVAFQASDEELEEAARRTIGLAAPPRAPRFWDDRELTHPNRPVVGVSWYEASAYCAWLTHILRSAGWLGADEEVRLPNEPEWEKAARGTEGRIYPWDDNWDAAKCNSLEGRVLLSTPVGVYPEGASPCGALDMAGNVWQWTRSLWGPDIETPRFGYPYDPEDGRENAESADLRVLRGGSWFSIRRILRCAYRDGVDPNSRSYDGGFRLVVSPASF